MKTIREKAAQSNKLSPNMLSDKNKIRKLTSLQLPKYKNVGLDHLVMYAIGQLEKLGADLSLENTVVASFQLFPHKFSLPGFFSYPDSSRVRSCLSRITSRTKQWLGGKTRQGFIITDRSKTFIREAENLLSGRSQKETKASSQTRRKEVILAEIESSTAYIKYKNGKGNAISEADFCFLLQGTLDSSKEILIGNLNTLKMFASELQREDILQFAHWLEERFEHFLVDKGE